MRAAVLLLLAGCAFDPPTLDPVRDPDPDLDLGPDEVIPDPVAVPDPPPYPGPDDPGPFGFGVHCRNPSDCVRDLECVDFGDPTGHVCTYRCSPLIACPSGAVCDDYCLPFNY